MDAARHELRLEAIERGDLMRQGVGRYGLLAGPARPPVRISQRRRGWQAECVG
jgi:hypothetical protein